MSFSPLAGEKVLRLEGEIGITHRSYLLCITDCRTLLGMFHVEQWLSVTVTIDCIEAIYGYSCIFVGNSGHM